MGIRVLLLFILIFHWQITFAQEEIDEQVDDEAILMGVVDQLEITQELINKTLSAKDISCPEETDRFERHLADPRIQKLIEKMKRNVTRCFRHGENYNKKYCPIDAHSKPAEQKTGYCYRYVKYGLYHAGIVDPYPNSTTYSEAKYAHYLLEANGFENILGASEYEGLNERNAPVGAILVYEPSNGQGSGHIEVKTEPNEYLSDFRESKPVSDYLPRKLIGIYLLAENEL